MFCIVEGSSLSLLGPTKVQTLSGNALSPPVSLGSASDVIVSLRCTVGGPNVAFAANTSRPFWLPPNVSYATIDSADSGIIWIEAARVTEDLRLECQFATDSSRRELQEVRFNRGTCARSNEAITQWVKVCGTNP